MGEPRFICKECPSPYQCAEDGECIGPSNFKIPPPSPPDIAAIRERANRATPGPWHDDEFVVIDPEGGVIAETGSDETYDAQFIAAARTDIPAFCDTVDSLSAALREKDAEIERLRDALRPFAALPSFHDIEEPDVVFYSNAGVHLTVGDARNARAALSPRAPGGEE